MPSDRQVNYPLIQLHHPLDQGKIFLFNTLAGKLFDQIKVRGVILSYNH